MSCSSGPTYSNCWFLDLKQNGRLVGRDSLSLKEKVFWISIAYFTFQSKRFTMTKCFPHRVELFSCCWICTMHFNAPQQKHLLQSVMRRKSIVQIPIWHKMSQIWVNKWANMILYDSIMFYPWKDVELILDTDWNEKNIKFSSKCKKAFTLKC